MSQMTIVEVKEPSRKKACKTATKLILAGLVVLAAASCAPFLKTPASFAEMDHPGYGYKYRALSPDEVTIAAKKRRNEPKGDLTFWTKVMKEKIPLVLGYKFAEEKDVATDSGIAGKLLRFDVQLKDGDYAYTVGIFLKKKKMWLFEAGGKVEPMKAHEAEILEAMKTMDI